MLRFDRKQQNSVKQLSFNLKNKFLKIEKTKTNKQTKNWAFPPDTAGADASIQSFMLHRPGKMISKRTEIFCLPGAVPLSSAGIFLLTDP